MDGKDDTSSKTAESAAQSPPPPPIPPNDATVLSGAEGKPTGEPETETEKLLRGTRTIEILQFAVNVALAVIGVMAVCIYGGQLKVMRGQLTEMQEDRRPWVFVTDSCMTPTVEYRKNLSPPTCPGQGHFFDSWPTGETLTWWIEISDTGRTPTESDLTAALCEFRTGEYPMPEDASCKQLKTIQTRPVSPGKGAGIVIGPSEYPITEQERQRVQQGDRLAIVARSRYSFGHTTYTDHFCLWYEPHGIQPLRFCEGSKYNYEEKQAN